MFRQTDTTGVINPYDLRRAWDGTVVLRAFAGGEDDEEDTDDGSGDGEDDGTDGSSGTDTDDTGADKGEKDIRDPEAKRTSNEAAKYRRRLRETEAELATLRKEKQEREDEGKDRAEVAERKLGEETARADAAEQRAVKAERQLAFITSGAANLVSDPDLALMLLDLKDLEPDDEGKFDAKEIISRTEALLKTKPVLKRSESDDSADEGKPNSSGQPSNRRKGDKKDDDLAALRNKFPALARR